MKPRLLEEGRVEVRLSSVGGTHVFEESGIDRLLSHLTEAKLLLNPQGEQGAQWAVGVLAEEVKQLTCQKNACQQVIAERDAEIDRLKPALKVIHTWAQLDLANGYRLLLHPRDVAKLCERTLKGEK